jgi:ABC-type multidrug transport system permease subunit
MSSANNGGRFFTYYLILVMFTLTLHQFFRFLAAIASSSATALPIAGLILIIMVLFCG